MKQALYGLIAFLLLLQAPALATGTTPHDVRKAIASGKPTLIQFGTSHCETCTKMKPTLEAVTREYVGRVNVLYVDVELEAALGRRFQVQRLPTQIFFDGTGAERKRNTGTLDREDIAAILSELETGKATPVVLSAADSDPSR